jgi:hypothetical protein
VVVKSDLRPIEDGSVLRFSRAIEIFIQSKRTLADAIELEQVKIDLIIPDVYRQQITMSAGVNPWVSDSHARIITSSSARCLFCGFSFADSVSGADFPHHPIFQ